MRVKRNSVVTPVVNPSGSIRNLTKLGRVFILICMPVETVEVGALGCDIIMLKDPEALRVRGFLS